MRAGYADQIIATAIMAIAVNASNFFRENCLRFIVGFSAKVGFSDGCAVRYGGGVLGR